MAYVTIPSTNFDAGNVPDEADLKQLNDNIAYLKSRLDQTEFKQVLNGSFEDGTVGTGQTPTNWTWTAHTGGTRAIVSASNTDQSSGANSFKITHPGGAAPNGGGYIETDEFIEVAASSLFYLAWRMKVSAANGADNQIIVYWYKEDQSASATTSTTIWSDTGGPTDWAQFLSGAEVPSDAKFCKIRIVGGDSATTPSGSQDIYFDDVQIVKGPHEVYAQYVEFLTTGTSVFTTPSDVQAVFVEAVGGGGDGLSSGNQTGGGGGEYAAGTVIVSASTGYSVVVGANSANSTFNSTDIIATAGADGSTFGGAGGTGGTGDLKFDGTDGGDVSSGDGGHAGKGAGGGPRTGSTGSAGAQPGGGGGGGSTGTNTGGAGMVKVWY